MKERRQAVAAFSTSYMGYRDASPMAYSSQTWSPCYWSYR